MNAIPVLIAGAGPTGMLLALALARHGVTARIVDSKPAITDTSRAIIIQARTLEFYDMLGIADDVLARGIAVKRLHVLQPGHQDKTVDLADIGAGTSAFAQLLCYPQDDHERLLEAQLRAAGIPIGWRTTLTALEQHETHVTATLQNADGRTETVEAQYLVGCDGGHSTARDQLGIGFDGGTYERRYFVADASLTETNTDDIRISFDSKILGLCFPVRPQQVRLLGVLPDTLADHDNDQITFDELKPTVESLLRVHVQHVNWFSLFRVHHRVASNFRKNRCFLAGDAGHVHSPVGGQGMNTGLGDAFNLAWKLAAVLKQQADPSLLDTYEQERIGFARNLVNTTDVVFSHLVGKDSASVVARAVAPRVIPALFRLAPVRHALFDTVSQIRIHYPDSPLSHGKAGDLAGGDRLPWIPTTSDADGDPGSKMKNYAPLRANTWQVHLYGKATTNFGAACALHGLPLHEFPWSPAAHHAGYSRDTAYLIRPDSYIGLVLPDQNPDRISGYLQLYRITMSTRQ